MCQAHQFDAMICIPNCDKIIPGMLMAALRLNIPTIFVSGGPMEAGRVAGKDVDLIDQFYAVAQHKIGKMTAARGAGVRGQHLPRLRLVQRACSPPTA